MDWVLYAFSVIFILASIVAWLWLVVRIWSTSAVGAVLTFFLGLPSLYFLFKYWGEEERDVRVPFFVNLGFSVAYIFFVLTVPSYKADSSAEYGRVSKQAAAARSNPEMERWCREKHDAVYNDVLGTCVEPDPDQESAEIDEPIDAIAQLEYHFLQNGLEVRALGEDESMSGQQSMARTPELTRMTQFEIKSKTILPTIFMIGECISPEACSRLASRRNASDGSFSIASNGSLMFFSFHIMGDEDKIKQARQLFLSFKAV